MNRKKEKQRGRKNRRRGEALLQRRSLQRQLRLSHHREPPLAVSLHAETTECSHASSPSHCGHGCVRGTAAMLPFIPYETLAEKDEVV
ncbi:hypothetical protein SESBI_11593 [Sesbania bispinosa]|nr:hypothetical protein SESBI_11593 [Sesbania bispinosa]